MRAWAGVSHLAMLGCTPNPELRGGVIRRIDDEAVAGFVIDSLNSITAVVLWYAQAGTQPHLYMCGDNNAPASQGLDKSSKKRQLRFTI